jgi:hypothetical protein
VSDHQRHRLRRVKGAATAEPNNPIAALSAIRLNAGLNVTWLGVGLDRSEDAETGSRVLESRLQVLEDVERREAPVGDDERALDSMRSKVLRELF